MSTMARMRKAEDEREHIDPPLTLSEVARRVNKTPQTVRRWIHDGLLKAIRLPSGLFGVKKSEVEKFIGASALAVKDEE